MIVVVGSPTAGSRAGALFATGLAADVARHAAAASEAVEIVGRVGEDPIGESVVLDLAAARIGHVALLRTPGRATPMTRAAGLDDRVLATAVLDAGIDEAAAPVVDEVPGLPLDAGDLDLALRYLPDYRVLVVAPGLDARGLSSVVGAAAWSGAHLVVVVDAGSAAPQGLPPDATILARPTGADDGTFAAVVARYATELDRGTAPAAAFAAASSGSGWASVAD